MREYGSNINLPSLDNLFSSEQERQDAKLEKIQILPLTELHPFRNHPFQVRDDDEMDKMVDSVKEYGVMTPAIVRPRKDGGYEIVAGHRRCHASQRAGVETMPCIVRDMDDDTAIILMVDSNCQREHMILNCQVSENEMVENPLMMLFGELERRDPQHPAVLQFKSFMLGAKKTLQSILISAAANLYMFNSRKFAEMTSRDEMFLPRMGLEQRALFIVLPDNDTTFNFIATMLYTQLFDQLFRLADSTPEYNGALPVHVRLMMDEFANVALPKNFKNILAVCRSRNISCDIILQNIAQLKSLFKDDWEGIIGNCDTLLYLGGNEYSTYEYLSKILGKETERTKSQSIGKGSRGSSSDSLQTAGRELCMPDEIRRMRDDECLLLMRSEDPVIDKKYNLLHHPNVKYTPDAGGEPYVMPPDYMGDAATITMDAVAAATAPEITEEMYEQLDYLEKHPEENYYENEENFSQYEQGD